jgi:hypothetical protein
VLNNPISGEEIENALVQLPEDPQIMQIYKEISGTRPLVPVLLAVALALLH